METNGPTLKRPKRKLCYLTNRKSPLKQWEGKLTLDDVDRMFDDLDSPFQGGPPSPLLQTSDSETNQHESDASPVLQEGHRKEKDTGHQMSPELDVLPPAKRSPSPKLEVDLDIPFKAHGPVKTSSPIEQNIGGDNQVNDNEKEQVVSPILFACEDEGKEDARIEPLLIQKPQCNGQATEEGDDSEFESPPSKVAFTKMSHYKKTVEESCKESHIAKEKTPEDPQTPVLKGKGKMPSRQENTQPPVLAARQEPELAAPEENSESVHREPPREMSTHVGKGLTAFRQKLKAAGLSKSVCCRKSVSPVKVPTPPPPEPEDEFVILEDDAPIWISIPRKTAISKTQRPSRTSSTDKDSSTDKGLKDSSLEKPQVQQETATSKLGSQAGDQKVQKKKATEKNNEVTVPGSDEDKVPSSEDLPAGDLMEQKKPNKKKQQLKKLPSKEIDKAEDQPEDIASREAEEEKPSRKMETKAHQSSKTRKPKSLKDSKDNTKTSKTKSLKGTRKGLQGSDDVKERVPVDVKEQSQEHADTEDLGSPIDKEVVKSEADGKAKQNQQPVLSRGSSSEDGLTLGKRKRKPTGQWWLSCPQSSEETDNQQPTLKKSKQKSKEPSTAAPSPVKKVKVLKKRNQKQSSQLTNKAEEKKSTQNKRRKGDSPDKVKATDEVFNSPEAEQTEEQEQQEIPDQDLDQNQSSPLVFTHKDHILNSGGDRFQRVYHHSSREKLSITPAVPVSPRQPKEQLREAEPAKRRRKSPGNWWMVNDNAEEVDSVSSQPQQLPLKEPKPRKERKKLSKQSKSLGLGIPKNGNVADSSKPLGGAPVTPVKLQQVLPPKTVKRSLATFKDIFASGVDTPSVVSNKDTRRNNRRNLISHPAEEVSGTDYITCSKTDLDVGECRSTQNSPHDLENSQDNKCQSETLKDLQSGPSSMIELHQFEENDDMILPSSRVQSTLSVSDLCSAPLKPLVLQPKDKANLTEWFKILWSTIADDAAEITPEQFDWYFYQDKAIGFQVDLNTSSVCNGKILLGSYTKKPLWVDHSTTTVFNLLTSSVTVNIDGSESHFSPGQSFMVQCGHAYSIQNATAQPAVLYFTRISAESSD